MNDATIEVHLYGKLRHHAANTDPRGDSILNIAADGDSIQRVIERIGIDNCHIGSNIFVNGEYSALDRIVRSGDRLALFPDDMQLLYKWYFAPRK